MICVTPLGRCNLNPGECIDTSTVVLQCCRFDVTPPAMSASVHVYSDGSVLVQSGGLEMGQGLHTKIKQVLHHRVRVWSRVSLNPKSQSHIIHGYP